MSRRRVTKTRAFGTSYHDGPPESYVRFREGWAAGAYEVVWRDHTVAHCTDKWMADLIFAALKAPPNASDAGGTK